MATSQYIREAVNPTVVPVATASLVNIGDFAALVAGECVPALDFTWTSNLATTQTNFAAAFLGHSPQYKPANVAYVYGNGTDNVITMSTSGVYEADLDSATTLAVGDWVGMAKDTGNNLLSQTVAKVDAVTKAIGTVVEAGTSLTRCRFRLLPTVVPFAR